MSSKKQTDRIRSAGSYIGKFFLGLSLIASFTAPVSAEDAEDIQKKIQAQRAENEQLKAKIAKLEQVLKTDVCANPEAAKLLEADEGGTTTPAPEAAEPPRQR
jgi:hypothetical protein